MVELLKRDGYILSRSDNPVPGTVDKFVYMITTEELPDVIAKRWTTNEEWDKTDLANDFRLFAESSVYSVFDAFIKKDTGKVKKSISYNSFNNIKQSNKNIIKKKTPVLIATKGIQQETCLFLHEVFSMHLKKLIIKIFIKIYNHYYILKIWMLILQISLENLVKLHIETSQLYFFIISSI